MKKTWIFVVTGLFLILQVVPTLYAAVNIEQNFQGTLIITDPNATDPDKLITMVDAGNALPAIPTGATLEVYDGSFVLQTDGADVVNVSLLDHEFTVSNGTQVSVTNQEDKGKVCVLKGSITFTDFTGQEITLAESTDEKKSCYEIGYDLDEAPETAAGEELGSELADDPPVDSRNLVSSP